MDRDARTTVDKAVERDTAVIEGRIVALQIEPKDAAPQLIARIEDGTGRLDAVFMGRRVIPGVDPGARIVVCGRVAAGTSAPRIFNPEYELL